MLVNRCTGINGTVPAKNFTPERTHVSPWGKFSCENYSLLLYKTPKLSCFLEPLLLILWNIRGSPMFPLDVRNASSWRNISQIMLYALMYYKKHSLDCHALTLKLSSRYLQIVCDKIQIPKTKFPQKNTHPHSHAQTLMSTYTYIYIYAHIYKHIHMCTMHTHTYEVCYVYVCLYAYITDIYMNICLNIFCSTNKNKYIGKH